MSSSLYVCYRDGAAVHDIRGGWRHSLGGRTGAIPAHRRHKAVPVLRADFERAYDVSTPRAEAMALIAGFKEIDRQVNNPRISSS